MFKLFWRAEISLLFIFFFILFQAVAEKQNNGLASSLGDSLAESIAALEIAVMLFDQNDEESHKMAIKCIRESKRIIITAIP